MDGAVGSFGEGFGLPTLQAASAGVVPVVPANSASTELVGNHGFAIPCDSIVRDEFGILRPFIDRQQATSALQELFRNPAMRRARSERARAFALEYSWDKIAASWHSLIDVRNAKNDGLIFAGPRFYFYLAEGRQQVDLSLTDRKGQSAD